MNGRPLAIDRRIPIFERMETPDSARLIYLVLLLVFIAAGYGIARRPRLAQNVVSAGIWFVIFVGGYLAFDNWDVIERATGPRQAIVTSEAGTIVDVPRRRDGHYYMELEVNGTPLQFVVDTGATHMVLSQADAQAVGIPTDELSFAGRARTANGMVRTAEVRLGTVSLGAIEDRDVRAIVNQGELDTSLLGMSYLQKFGKIEIEGDRLRLIR